MQSSREKLSKEKANELIDAILAGETPNWRGVRCLFRPDTKFEIDRAAATMKEIGKITLEQLEEIRKIIRTNTEPLT